MNRDGSFKLAANLPLLIGKNLRADLEAALKLTVRIANDADAGALGEWSVLRQEMLYWVFGGGWGGAWVSKDGHVRFPSIGWDGRDESLHLSNEPGYATPLDKPELRRLFAESGACFEHWEQVMLADFGVDSKILVGPSGRDDKLRAEAILSGPGRCRLFKAVAAGKRFHERFLSPAELAEMDNPAVAGRHISKLSALQVPAAVETDRLFGRILAHAAGIIFENARADGLPEGVPVALGGKPAQALPWFGPACQAELARLGISSYLRPGVIASRGGNANLLGAAVLAVQGD
jgi:predicted NBD/HSP70 family sugar kinase